MPLGNPATGVLSSCVTVAVLAPESHRTAVANELASTTIAGERR